MDGQTGVECADAKQLEFDPTEKVKLKKGHFEYKDKFFNMLSIFKNMLDEHSIQTSAVKHQIALTSLDVQPRRSATYGIGLWAHEFEGY